MNSATKQADWANHIPAYAAGGSGLFALGALLNEVRRAQAGEQQRKRQQLPQNALVIDLPRQAKTAEEKFYKQASGMLEGLVDHSLSAAVGAPLGFMGTKLLYDKYKKNQTDQEISAANIKYLRALQALQQKSAATKTPLVDSFCKSAAETLRSKEGGVFDAVKTLGGGLAKRVGSHLGAHPVAYPAAGFAGALGVDALKQYNNGPRTGTPGGVAATIKKLLATTAILSGLGTAGAMVNANNKRDSKGPEAPTAVALNYEDLPPASTLQ